MRTLIQDVEEFIALHNVAPTTFGNDALGDRHFVFQLRRGRDCKLSTAERVRTFMAEYEPKRQETAA